MRCRAARRASPPGAGPWPRPRPSEPSGGLPELASGAQAARLGARVVGDLAGARHDRAPGDQLGLGLAPAYAHGEIGRADTAARPLREEALHAPVLERVEGDRREAAVLAQELPREGERATERVELRVHRDADRLEDALRGAAAAEAPPHSGRQRALDGRDELAGRPDRRALAPTDDLARDAVRVRVLAEAPEELSELALVPGVHDLARVDLLARVHAHVERRVVGVGEAALAGVDLHRRDAEVEVDHVRRDALLAQEVEPVGVVHAKEAGLARHLARELF